MTAPRPDAAVLACGASNLAFLGPEIYRALARACPGSLAVYAASGLGRSYVQTAGVLGYATPAHRRSGVLPAFLRACRAAGGRFPRAALLLDFGNDLFYGTAMRDVVSAAGGLLARLEDAEVPTFMMPISARMDEPGIEARYNVVAPLLYPGTTLTFAQCRERLAELSAGIAGLAALHARVVSLLDTWPELLGPDRIHYRWRGGEAAHRFASPLARSLGFPEPEVGGGMSVFAGYVRTHRQYPRKYVFRGEDRDTPGVWPLDRRGVLHQF